MSAINRLFTQFGKKKVFLVLFVIVALIVYILFFKNAVTPSTTAPATVAEVTTAPVRSLVKGSAFGAVGTVQAVSEAELHVESGGRVIAVYPTLGATVRAGTIIARLDSAMQSASVLQAQGAYEAALAGAAQGNVGLAEAENGVTAAKNAAVTTYKNAYTTVSGVVFTTIDQFFSNPNGFIPGVRLGSSQYVNFLNTERVALQTSLPAWQNKTTSFTPSSNLESGLSDASVTTRKVLAMVDAYIGTLNREEPTQNRSEADIRALITTFTGVRTQLIGVLSSIDAAKTGLTAANEGLNRATISSTGTAISGADAQVKIALGSLRAAQALYEKTVVRTPITGVVNALYLKTGEYATPGQRAALIANNKGLEIITSVSQEDSIRLQVGDTVQIDGTATGTISAIAGAIDPTTGKVALKISVNENGTLQNGATVSLSFESTTKKSETNIISIPLAAIKMTGSGPIVFTVTGASSTLTAVPVVLGAISGENVVVSEGITFDSVIVVDARGHKAGESVTVNNK